MQEYYDEQEVQIKKLAKFDVEKENDYKRLSVYEFLFHIWILNDED